MVFLNDTNTPLLIDMQHASQNCLVILWQVLSHEYKMHRHVKNST